MRTHGLSGTYGAGCRCADCREAARVHRQVYRLKAKGTWRPAVLDIDDAIDIIAEVLAG